MTRPLRVAVFDRTCAAKGIRPGLTSAWRAGTLLYRGLGRLDASFGASSWDEALDWLATFERDRELAEIQYWGHGKWGHVLIDRDVLAAPALVSGHPLHAKLEAVRERLAPDPLVWLRTCETFGARIGHDFAQRLAELFGARVAGHTFVIGVLQSGLHGLHPGAKPDWPTTEGLAEGTPDAPKRAHDSAPDSPRTITCFTSAVPADWFAR